MYRNSGINPALVAKCGEVPSGRNHFRISACGLPETGVVVYSHDFGYLVLMRDLIVPELHEYEDQDDDSSALKDDRKSVMLGEDMCTGVNRYENI